MGLAEPFRIAKNNLCGKLAALFLDLGWVGGGVLNSLAFLSPLVVFSVFLVLKVLLNCIFINAGIYIRLAIVMMLLSRRVLNLMGTILYKNAFVYDRD